MTALSPHPDRLFPPDPTERAIARRLYSEVADAPIYSPHGHVDAAMLHANQSFPDPAALLITPDHYVTRMLHASGVPLEDLGLARNGVPSTATGQDIWRVLCTHWDLFLGTPVRFWFESFPGRVVPTFRADRYLNPAEPTWVSALERLHEVSGIDCGSYVGLLDALRSRREYFLAHGATATDTGAPDAGSTPLSVEDAERLHRAGLNSSITADESVAYRRNMLYRFAEMAADDGLVMQLHPGVIRNHDRPTFDAFGPDTGHDLPDVTLFTRPLTPVLRDFGSNPKFRLVLFTVDETSFSREIAPLAGFYPSVYAGAPWWFLDSPAGIARYRSAITDSAGFSKTSGFIDDTRAFCSIPARHEMSRRCDAAFLASLVASHQVSEDDAAQLARDLVGRIPINTFRLER